MQNWTKKTFVSGREKCQQRCYISILIDFRLVINQKKLDKGMATFGFYNTREYIWKNDQLRNLPNEMSENDRKIFFCDFKSVRKTKS